MDFKNIDWPTLVCAIAITVLMLGFFNYVRLSFHDYNSDNYRKDIYDLSKGGQTTKDNDITIMVINGLKSEYCLKTSRAVDNSNCYDIIADL